MRKLIRATLRHQAYRTHTGHEGFLALWRGYRIMNGKSYVRGKRRSHDLIIRRRIVNWFKRLGGKA